MTSAAQATYVPAGTYSGDPNHSTFAFAVAHNGRGTFRAHFRDVSATLRSDGDALTIEGSAKVDSIDVVLPRFLAHLLSDEFLDAESHPELSFRSTEVRLDGEHAEVDGELTVRGISKPVTATGTLAPPVDNPFGHTIVALALETVVDRADFGIVWNMDLPNGGQVLGDQVAIRVDVEFDRQP